MPSPDEASSYRQNELEIQFYHYGYKKFHLPTKFPAIITPEIIRNEWRVLKHIIRIAYLNKTDHRNPSFPKRYVFPKTVPKQNKNHILRRKSNQLRSFPASPTN